jgi:hypothetical protein
MVGTTIVMWINGGNNDCNDVDGWMLGTTTMRCGSMVETMGMIWINGGNNHI